jgi:hypothetical protein
VTVCLGGASAVDRESPESAMDGVHLPKTPGASVLVGGQLPTALPLPPDNFVRRWRRGAADAGAHSTGLPTAASHPHRQPRDSTVRAYLARRSLRAGMVTVEMLHVACVQDKQKSRREGRFEARNLAGTRGRGREALSVRNGHEFERKRHPALTRNSCAKYMHYPGEGQGAISAQWAQRVSSTKGW